MKINDFAERNIQKNVFFESIDLSQGGCNIEFYTDEKTKRFYNGINVLDHIIFNHSDYFSKAFCNKHYNPLPTLY